MAWFYQKDMSDPLHREALGISLRVVSFLGAATEVVCLLGCENLLVGRSHECRRPASILSLPCVSSADPIGPNLEELSSREIDEKVRGLVERGLARYKIDADLLRSLEPDVILTQDQCSVCAVTSADLESACSRFFHESRKPCRVVSLRPKTMSDVWENVRTIADALHVSEKGDRLIRTLQTQWDSIRRTTPQYTGGMPPLRVACLQWTDPLIGAGFWVPEIVSCAGGVNLLGEKGGGSPVVTLESIAQARPEVIVVMCCGLELNRGVSDVEKFERQAGWLGLRPVRNGRVYVVNGDRYFNTSSAAAAVESAQLMAEMLHGGRSDLEGTAYVRRPAIVPSSDVTPDVTSSPRTASVPPRPAPPLPTWLRKSATSAGHFPGGPNGHSFLSPPGPESPVSTPSGSGFRLFESAAPTPAWGGSPTGSSPREGIPPEERTDPERLWMGNDSDEEGWGGGKDLVLGGFSDSDDSDDDFENVMDVPLVDEKWSLEGGTRLNSGLGGGSGLNQVLGLTQGLVLDSELDAIAEGVRRRRGDVSSTANVMSPVGDSRTAHVSRTRTQPLSVPRRNDTSPDGSPRDSVLGYGNHSPYPSPDLQSPVSAGSRGWQDPLLSPDSLRSSPTRWANSHLPGWPETPRTPQTPHSPDEVNSDCGRGPFGLVRGPGDVNPSRFAEEAGLVPGQETGFRRKGFERGGLEEGGQKWGKGFDAEEEIEGDERKSISSPGKTTVRQPGFALRDVQASGEELLFGVVDTSPQQRGRGPPRMHLDVTGLTPLEGPHSPLETPTERNATLETVCLDSPPLQAQDPGSTAVSTPPGAYGGELSAFRRLRPTSPGVGRQIQADVSTSGGIHTDDVITPVRIHSDDDVSTRSNEAVSPPARPGSPALEAPGGGLVSPVASRPGVIANLLQPQIQTSPPGSPVQTPPPLRSAFSASPPRSPSSPPNFALNSNPADLPALLDLGSVPAVKTLTPIRTGRQSAPPVPLSPPFAPSDPARNPLGVPGLAVGQCSPSPPSSPSVSPHSSSLENSRRLENGYRPPRSPRSPQTAHASPRFSPLSVLPYLSLDLGLDPWLSSKALDPAEFAEETGLQPMETFAGESGIESDVTSLEDSIRGSMDRWMWGEIGMDGVTAAAGLDGVDFAGENNISARGAGSDAGPSSSPYAKGFSSLCEGDSARSEGAQVSPEGVRMRPLTSKAEELRNILEEALEAALPADCIILSGGLDTCVLAELAVGGGKETEYVQRMGQGEAENQGDTLRARGHSALNTETNETSRAPKSGQPNKQAHVRKAMQQHIRDSPTGSSHPASDESPTKRGSNAATTDETDTSRSSADSRIKEAFTVLTGEQATDRPYAAEIARRCGLRHTVIEIPTPEALLERELEFVVRTLRTFDPMEVRNSIAVAAALREAHRRGYRSAITGDGADELMGGYSFTQKLPPEKFEQYRLHLNSVMRFAAVPLGAALGIEVRQPYLYPKLVDYALGSLAKKDLVGPVRGELLTADVRRGIDKCCRGEDLARLDRGDVHGKLALREAFPGVYSAWRSKDPIEVGCGTTVLPTRFQEALSAVDLAAAQRTIQEEDGVKIRDAEHLYYYKAFRRIFGPDCPAGMHRWGSDPCDACGFQLQQPTQTFCVVCGEYPARASGNNSESVGGEVKKAGGELLAERVGSIGLSTEDVKEVLKTGGGLSASGKSGGVSKEDGEKERTRRFWGWGSKRPEGVNEKPKSALDGHSGDELRGGATWSGDVRRTSSVDSADEYASAKEELEEPDG